MKSRCHLYNKKPKTNVVCCHTSHYYIELLTMMCLKPEILYKIVQANFIISKKQNNRIKPSVVKKKKKNNFPGHTAFILGRM